MTTYPEIPNIRHLRMTQAIGRLNGVSAASRQLNTSQPAVTQAVANIEEQVGAPIFDRRATGTFPTEVGRVFLRRIDRFFDILDGAIAEILPAGDLQPDRPSPQIERHVTGTQLRSLVVASEPATLEAAAAAMNVSSASLYRSARTLENALGRKLFDRTASGPECNRIGMTLARQVRRAVREIEFGMAEVTLALGNENLEIVVGMLPMAGTSELAGAVRRFAQLRPSARISIRAGTYHALLDDLANCRVDMIFGLLRTPEWETEIEEELMFTDSYCVVCRPDHPLALLDRVTPAALVEYDWIVPAKGSPRRSNFEKIFEGTDLQPRCNIEVNSLNCTRAMLLESDMLTVMARSEVSLDEGLGTLTALTCAELNSNSPKGITTRRGWLPTDGHRQFLNCLRDTTANATYGATGWRPPVALAG